MADDLVERLENILENVVTDRDCNIVLPSTGAGSYQAIEALAEEAAARIRALEDEVRWIGMFATVRATDRGEVTVRVAKGAFRTIADKASRLLHDEGEGS